MEIELSSSCSPDEVSAPNVPVHSGHYVKRFVMYSHPDSDRFSNSHDHIHAHLTHSTQENALSRSRWASDGRVTKPDYRPFSMDLTWASSALNPPVTPARLISAAKRLLAQRLLKGLQRPNLDKVEIELHTERDVQECPSKT